MSRNEFEILSNAKKIDTLACKIRESMFGDDKTIHDKLEEKISGLKNIRIETFVAAEVPGVDGFVNYSNRNKCATIYLSDGLLEEDRNFTLMHEFAHLIFDFGWSFVEGKPRKSNALLVHSRTDIQAANKYEERRVNEFAASFLIPYKKEDGERLKTSSLRELIAYYGVSSRVIERRRIMFEKNPIN